MPDSSDDRVYSPTQAVAKIGKQLRTGFVPAPGVHTLSGLNIRNATTGGLPNFYIGQRLRDDWWQKFPLLPALVRRVSA